MPEAVADQLENVLAEGLSRRVNPSHVKFIKRQVLDDDSGQFSILSQSEFLAQVKKLISLYSDGSLPIPPNVAKQALSRLANVQTVQNSGYSLATASEAHVYSTDLIRFVSGNDAAAKQLNFLLRKFRMHLIHLCLLSDSELEQLNLKQTIRDVFDEH